MMQKNELRALYKEIRLRMSRSEVSSKSRMIGRKLLNEIEWHNYKTISVFEPIKHLNEVEITGVISRLKSQSKDVHILSSDRGSAVPKLQFDLIIVPCLA